MVYLAKHHLTYKLWDTALLLFTLISRALNTSQRLRYEHLSIVYVYHIYWNKFNLRNGYATTSFCHVAVNNINE